jgi:hypothetical protein
MLLRKAHHFCLLLIWILSVLTPAFANAGGQSSEAQEAGKLKLKIGVYQFRDSEDFDQRVGHVWTEFFFAKKFFLRANAAHHILTQDTSEFGANGVDFVLGTTFGSATELTIGGGLTGFDSVGGDFAETDLSYQGSFAFKPVGTGHLTLAYDHKNLLHDAKSLGALRDLISSHEFRPSYYQWISERWSFWTGLGYGMYSDENTRISINASVTYLFRPEPMFGLLYAFGYTSCEQRSDAYWDPDGYQSHNLVLWLQQPLGKYFSFEFKGSTGYSLSESEPNAWASLLLDVHPSRSWTIQMNGHVMGNPARDQDRSSTPYSATTVSADLIWTP